MSFKKVSIQELKKLGLPESSWSISFNPYYKLDSKKKIFNKPIPVFNVIKKRSEKWLTDLNYKIYERMIYN